MPNDFSLLDFDSLWKGRDKVSEIEKSVILDLIAGRKFKRVLEVGVGAGRIQEGLRSVSENRFAVDLETRFLERVHLSDPGIVTVHADLHSMPFTKGYFDLILMIRVLNFLKDAQNSIRILTEYLKNGGLLIVSFYHYPSIAYLLDRFYSSTALGNGDPMPGAGMSRVYRSGFEEFFYRKMVIKKAGESCSLLMTGTVSTGLGDYKPFKYLPISTIRMLEKFTVHFSILPHIFARFQKNSSEPVIEFQSPFSCEVCGTPFNSVPAESCAVKCIQCGSVLSNEKGIVTFHGNP